MDRQCPSCGGFCKKSGCERESVKPKEWVGLTEDELEDLEFASVDREYGHLDIRVLSRAIEQQLKEKNGG